MTVVVASGYTVPVSSAVFSVLEPEKPGLDAPTLSTMRKESGYGADVYAESANAASIE